MVDFDKAFRKTPDSFSRGISTHLWELQRKEDVIVKKKLSVGLVFAIVIMLVAVTALAAVAIKIHSDMQKAVEMSEQGVFERWELEDKKRFIALMEEFGIEMDTEMLAVLKANEGNEEELDQLAGEIINAVYLERSRRDIPEWIYQPEDYPSPNYFTIFEDLWLRKEPEATVEEIRAAYEIWENEAWETGLLEAPIPSTPETAREDAAREEARRISVRTEEEMLLQFDSYLSEVLSFSNNERRKTEVSAKFLEDLQLWEVTLTIRAEDAKPFTIEYLTEWMSAFYDEEDATYSAAVYYKPNGEGIGWSLNEYLVRSLIPTSEYPGDAEPGNEFNSFLAGTVEEKAAFSTKWKPVVDEWLAEHPDIVQWLEQDTGLYDAILFTRHAYGIPSEKAIPQETAIAIAKKAYLDSGVTGISYVTGGITKVTEEMIRERCSVYFFYDITDVDHPLWKIWFMYAAYENPLQEDHKDGYFVIVDAFSGQILNGYTTSGPGHGSGRYEDVPQGSFQIAEDYM